jgi:GTP cyclohydrolase IA
MKKPELHSDYATPNSDEWGENHFSSTLDTPMRPDAFELSDEEKIQGIRIHFRKIMELLGLDLTDPSLSGTPNRVAKMYVKELFSGLNPSNLPKLSTFPNTYTYTDLLIEKDIELWSNCEHHFLPIHGSVHIAYKPDVKVIGLSKIHRIVNYYGRRPQVQERLTRQIATHLQQILETPNVAVIVHAKHLCVSSRGIKDQSSITTTMELNGVFESPEMQQLLFQKLAL